MTSIHSSVYNVIRIIMHCYIFRAHMNQRSTLTYVLPQSVSDLDRQYIKLIIFLFLFALSFKRSETSAHSQYAHTKQQIHLFIWYVFRTITQHRNIHSWNRMGQRRKKLRERERLREHSKKLVRTSFVIDDEESNHVNLAFCCTLSLFYYSISIFLAHSKTKNGRRKKVQRRQTTSLR